jgi:hypothetical protein
MAWEEIEVPKGSYVGWGNRTGQHVTGGLLSIDPVGATCPPKPGQTVGDPCPLLEFELTEPAASYDRDLNRTDFEAGQEVCLSVSQKQLQRAVAKAHLRPDDLVRIELTGSEKTTNGTVKLFKILVDRGAFTRTPKAQSNNMVASTSAPAGRGYADDEPPF